MTGATGFLGKHVVEALAARGFRVRILARRDPSLMVSPELAPEFVRGDLDDTSSLARLVRGADVVVHAAGLIKARSRGQLLAVNRDGAARLARAARREAPGAHLLGISSLAARAPFGSAYAESKHAGEAALADGFTGRLTLLRPSVIYGPGDRETLAIFRAAARRVVPVPGPAWARVAMIDVGSASAAIAAVAGWHAAPGGTVHALADGNPHGYAPVDILRWAADAVDNQPRLVHLPPRAVRLAGRAASVLTLLRGRPSVFSAGKAREMVYGKWGVALSELIPASVFTPETDLRQGFASAVAWYRQAGWLAPSRRGRDQ